MIHQTNNFLHRFGRAAVAEGQFLPDQAPARSGHNVDVAVVRGQDIPECRYRSVLLGVDGSIRPPYDTLMRYWNKARMTEFPNSNGESWRLIDQAGNAVSDFLDPSDRLVNGVELSRGYAQEFFGTRPGSTQLQLISPSHYVFNAFNGILTFDKGQTPTDLGYDQIFISAFQYTGKKVKQKLKNIDQLFAMTMMLMQRLEAERVVVQPYKFDTSTMDRVWPTPRPIPGAFDRFGHQIWSQRFAITVPGYVFQVAQLNGSQTQKLHFDIPVRGDTVVMPDIVHNSDGSSRIEIQLQVNAGIQSDLTGDGRCVLGYASDGLGGLRLLTGDIQFSASAFKRNDGKMLDVKPPIQLGERHGEVVPITPQLKKKLLVEQYRVDFQPTDIDNLKTQQLFQSLYQKR